MPRPLLNQSSPVEIPVEARLPERRQLTSQPIEPRRVPRNPSNRAFPEDANFGLGDPKKNPDGLKGNTATRVEGGHDESPCGRTRQ